MHQFSLEDVGHRFQFTWDQPGARMKVRGHLMAVDGSLATLDVEQWTLGGVERPVPGAAYSFPIREMSEVRRLD